MPGVLADGQAPGFKRGDAFLHAERPGRMAEQMALQPAQRGAIADAGPLAYVVQHGHVHAGAQQTGAVVRSTPQPETPAQYCHETIPYTLQCFPSAG